MNVPVIPIADSNAPDCKGSGNRCFSSNYKDPSRTPHLVLLTTGKRNFETMDRDVPPASILLEIANLGLSCEWAVLS